MRALPCLALALAATGFALPTAAAAQQTGTTGFDTGPSLTGPSIDHRGGMSARQGNWEIYVPSPHRARFRQFLSAQDYPGLIAFLETRAQSADVWAMVQLGSIYAQGEIVEADIVKSLNWYATAATRGDAASALLLGSVYASGEIVRPDPEKAEYWLTLAEANGDYQIKRDVERVRERI